MKDNYDLKNPRTNPYAERMKSGYSVIIDHNTDEDEEDNTTEADNIQLLQTQTKK